MKTKWRKKDSGKDSSRLSHLISYLYDEQKLKTLLKITGTEHDFTSMTPEEKNDFLNRLTKATHKQSNLYYGNSDTFHSGATNCSSVVLLYILSYAVLRYTGKIQRLFVPKLYHNRRDKSFLKNLIYIGEKKEIGEKYFYEVGTSLGRRLYKYQIDKNNKRPLNIHPRDLDWPFPDKFYESTGYTVHGFLFRFKNLPNSISSILNPSYDLINIESNTEQAENNLTEELFSKKKILKKK